LDNTEFGIEILSVVEILKMMKITSVPIWPDFAKGTIKLRSRVIPVVDLRQKFSLSSTEETEKTCTIVVERYGHAFSPRGPDFLHPLIVISKK